MNLSNCIVITHINELAYIQKTLKCKYSKNFGNQFL
jgi:hypothetical protein